MTDSTKRTDEAERLHRGSPLEANHAWGHARQLERELADAVKWRGVMQEIADRNQQRVLELERELARAKMIKVYSTDECGKHRGNHVWDIDITPGLHNFVKVCPLCERSAK